ncbi:MAG TPA: RNA methyltransferase [Candidatus Scatomonas pullistercoris]|uniref:RNA methyltransferase n=1 Tax=Candidatus Scatomonas pullistercoris TaxID=2840920 RepID=A0A9D1TBV9_9FIRM|nr:RNA methyltransferase [Candidatus Scatomonas pullistercoris]
MITSSSNSQIKRITQLNAKGKLRREEGVFVAEGLKLFMETPEELREKVFVSETFERAHKELLRGVSLEVVEDSLFVRMCDTKTPQGILSVVRMPSYTWEQVTGGAAPLLLVLEDLQDPGNLGTILRTAEGAGVTGVILSRGCVDLFHPKTIRSTMGSVYRVPYYCAEDLPEAVKQLKRQGVRIYAAHLEGKNSYAGEDYRGACAFLIGNEGNGLGRRISEEADCLIRIPMEGKVESLNAAVAAAVLMYGAHACRHAGRT